MITSKEQQARRIEAYAIAGEIGLIFLRRGWTEDAAKLFLRRLSVAITKDEQVRP